MLSRLKCLTRLWVNISGCATHFTAFPARLGFRHLYIFEMNTNHWSLMNTLLFFRSKDERDI
jgi:hypothetical protein